MSLESKYLKYKAKYLNTKNTLNSLIKMRSMRGGATKVGLFIVDPQNDFCAGGALAVPDAEAIFGPINKLKSKYEGLEQPIFISQDWTRFFCINSWSRTILNKRIKSRIIYIYSNVMA